MTDDDRILLGHEVAELLRCTPSQVRTLWRRGHLTRVPPSRPPRYTRASVERLLEDYHATDAEPHWSPTSEAATPRRGNRRAPQGQVASEALGSGGAVPRRIGPTPADVVVRRVTR